jgi:hypothetical protein
MRLVHQVSKRPFPSNPLLLLRHLIVSPLGYGAEGQAAVIVPASP